MTILTTAAQVILPGDGSSTTFAFTFVYGKSDWISVKYTSPDLVETTLAPGSYTLALNPAASNALWGVGGSVTLNFTPPINSTVTIERTLPLTQVASFLAQAGFSPRAIEQALDRLEMQIQQVDLSVTLGLRDAGGFPIINVGDPQRPTDAANVEWVEAFVAGIISGQGTILPTTWTFTGNGVTILFSTPAPDTLGPTATFFVTIDGVDQTPVIDFVTNAAAQTCTFTTAPPSGSAIVIRSFGYARGVVAPFVPEYATVAVVQATSLSGITQWFRTSGYYTAGDGGGSTYRYATVQSAAADKIQSGDGAYWQIADDLPNLQVFGAKADGATSPMAIIAAASALNYQIIFSRGTWKLTTASIKNSVVETGATLALTAVNTITFTGGFSAPPTTIFSGTGVAAFAAGSGLILPEWWGAKADGVTDCATAINNAISAAYISGNAGGTVQLGLGIYYITTQINQKSGVVVQGMGPGGDWSGVADFGPHNGTRIKWGGALTGFAFITVWDNDTIEATFRDFLIDGSMPLTTIPSDAPIALLWRSGKGNKLINVTLCNVGYGLFQAANISNTLATGHYIDNFRIFNCYKGIYIAGLAVVPPTGAGAITNSYFHNITIWNYYTYGIDFVLWSDNNSFQRGLLVGSTAGNVGIVMNSGDPTNPVGCGNNSFRDFEILQGVTATAALLVNNTNAPGGEPAVMIYEGTVNGPVPVVQNGGVLKFSMRGQPIYTTTEYPIVGGGVELYGNPTTTYVTSPAAVTYFDSARFCDNFGGVDYAKFQIVSLKWVIDWDPGTTTGGVQLRNETNTVTVSTQAPGAAGRVKTSVDLTAYRSANWITGEKQLFIQTRGDGVTAPTIYRSWLEIKVSGLF